MTVPLIVRGPRELRRFPGNGKHSPGGLHCLGQSADIRDQWPEAKSTVGDGKGRKSALEDTVGPAVWV